MFRSGMTVSGLTHAAVALGVASGLLAAATGFARVARAQDSTAPAFEVATIKPAGPANPAQARLFEFVGSYNPSRLFSIGGRRVEARGTTAAQLVAAAYLIPVREIVGPSWMSDVRFDVEALMPADQGRDKASDMLRTLLEQRLALKAHHETRRMSGYTLSIGKGGPKLREVGPPVPTEDYARKIKAGFNGDQMDHCDMAQLVNILAQELGVPVVDETGLKGHYAIVLQGPLNEWADEAARPAIFRDALSDYGLRLAAGQVVAPVLVIDNMSKTPTEN